jgi:hypothetical protein
MNHDHTLLLTLCISLVLFVIISYMFCGIITYGAIFAYLQREWPEMAFQNRYEDSRLAFRIASSPVGLLVVLKTRSFRYGLKYRFPKKL